MFKKALQISCLLLPLCLSNLAHAYSSNSQQKTIGARASSEQVLDSDIEVIEVTGELTMGWYREQIFAKKEAYYTALNELIEDEEFHIICGRAAGIGSLFEHYQIGDERKICEPNFASTLRAKMVFERTGGTTFNNSNLMIPLNRQEFRKRYQQEQKKMVEIVKAALLKSPELAAKIREISDAQIAYQKAHIERFGKLSKYAYMDIHKD